MAAVKPYYTTDGLLESIKLRIAYPLSSSTFTGSNLIKFLNEELQLSAVPALLSEHEEYLIYNKLVPIVPSLSRYPIPDRSIGMTLRDLKFCDTNGNLFDMSRVAPEDKAYFQSSSISTQTYGIYYLQNNDVVLTPINPTNNNGWLRMDFAMRPNQLVYDDRACVIQKFRKKVAIENNGSLVAGATFGFYPNYQQNVNAYVFTAVASSPSLYEFEIGATADVTAANLQSAIIAASISGVTATIGTNLNVVDISYSDISYTFTNSANSITNFIYTNDTTSIQFNQLPTSWTNIDTNVSETLYSVDCLVDFLQTGSGHKTFTYDVTLLSIEGTVGTFDSEELKYRTFNVNSTASQVYYIITIGDYICLQNECIIPQIPSELHSALAERVAARIQRAIGDREGYAISKAEIAEMNKNQNLMIGQRVEGSVNKVFNRSSLLRMGKYRWGRRF